jgi:hypothetical protein
VGGALHTNVFRRFEGAGNHPWAAVYPKNGDPTWYDEYKPEAHRMRAEGYLFSPPGAPHAFKLIDVDGDGDTDILYHPSFAGGLGLGQPWASYLQRAPGTWQSFDELLGRPQLWLASGGLAPPDPFALAAKVSDYADLDGDGVIDAFALRGQKNLLGGPSPGNHNQFDDPKLRDFCNWWFSKAAHGGAIDPVRDRSVAFRIPAQVFAAWTIDRALAENGLNDPSLSAAMARALPPIEAHEVPGLPPLQVGMQGPGFCYSPALPINAPWLPDVPENPIFVVGDVWFGRGMLLDDPTGLARGTRTGLPYFPLRAPSFEVVLKQHGFHPDGTPVYSPDALKVGRSVLIPLVDLDGDGRPEIVSLKSSSGKRSEPGPGVWRVHPSQVHEHALFPVWEGKEPRTLTRFTSSRWGAFYHPHKPSPLLQGNAAEQCNVQWAPRIISSPSKKWETAMVRLRGETNRVIDDGLVPILWSAGVEPAQVRQEIARLLEESALSEHLRQRVGAAVVVDNGPQGPITYTPEEAAERNRAIHLEGSMELGAPKRVGAADWVSTFLDVNGDGLPDLVTAIGASCVDGINLKSDQKEGFYIFLNRGDRFEDKGGKPWEAGPFALARGWSDTELPDWALARDRNRFPFSAFAFADVDADGVGDAVLSAVVNVDHNFSRRAARSSSRGRATTRWVRWTPSFRPKMGAAKRVLCSGSGCFCICSGGRSPHSAAVVWLLPPRGARGETDKV